MEIILVENIDGICPLLRQKVVMAMLKKCYGNVVTTSKNNIANIAQVE